MRPLLLALAVGCGPRETPTVEVGSVSIALHTPADVDPLLGAEERVARVVGPISGELLAIASGVPDGELVVPDLAPLGAVIVEITAEADGAVLAAARTRPILVGDGPAAVDALFLPVNRGVELTHTLFTPRVGHAAFPTPLGPAVIVGGRAPSSTDVYERGVRWDPITGFTDDGPLLPRAGHHMTVTPYVDGSWLGSGGVDDDGAVLSETWQLTADGGRIDPVGRMTSPRSGHCLVNSIEDAALAIGGLDDPPIAVDALRADSWFQYLIDDLAASSVPRVVTRPSPLLAHAVTDDGAWGVFDLRPSSGNDIPDAFYAFPGNQPALDGAVVLQVGRDVLILGGLDTSRDEVVANGLRLDPIEGQLTDDIGLPSPRAFADHVWVDDDTVAIAGGYSDPLGTDAVTSLLLLDVNLGTVLLQVEVPVREGRLVVAPGGVVAVLGGLGPTGQPAGAWAVLPWVDDR